MRPFRTTSWLAVAMTPALLAWGLTIAPTAHGQAEPYYWRQRVFFIPYQPSSQDPQASKVEKVQLLVSRDGGQQWAVLQEAEPRVRGFSYHAAADGEYAFALRMSDRRGNLWPEQIAQPLLRVVVDTQPPTLQLAASLDATGQVVIKYEARDQKLKPQTLRLEAQTDAGEWQRIALGPPDLSQPDRLLGQIAWRPPTAGGNVRFRASVEDAAGNPGANVADASLVGPVLDPAFGPQLAPPDLQGPAMIGPRLDSQAAQSADWPRTPTDPPRTPLEWPSNNRFASDQHRAADASPAPGVDPFAPRTPSATPPFQNAYTNTASSATASSAPWGGSASTAPANNAPPPDNSGAPSLLPAQPVSAPTATIRDGWTSVGPTTGPPPAATFGAVNPAANNPAPNGPTVLDRTTWVNSLTFDLDYDIQTVGPWGVARVELWGTKDGGRQWQSLGVDQDNRSPMRVTVPAAGVYGFRIIVDGGNGAAAAPPRAGETPELIVGVDLEPPRAELRIADAGQGPFAGQVIIRWSALDENLAARPVDLFYSAAAEGPWSTIATDVDNSGEYAWRLGREAPAKVFLRLEVRDVAGNVEVQQSPTAIDLNVPRPTGRLRNVRPVESDPNRYRTASGERPAEG